MMKIMNWQAITDSEKSSALERSTQTRKESQSDKVAAIIDRVNTEGDQALVEFARRFDQAELSTLTVTEKEIQQAIRAVKASDREAIEFAIERNTIYQKALKPKSIQVNTIDGVSCERQTRAIDHVGLYVPGGSAALVSTVIMLAIPASIAGCPNRMLCTPPKPDGRIDANLLFTAQRCGISTIYKVGGAQAIAAMAYGTESIAKVDKIFGPGNGWVTEAKRQVAQNRSGVLIDMPAGPSELLVIADDNADPTLVAADLLSQAEHGPDSQVIAITLSKVMANQIRNAVSQQLLALPRKAIAEQALSQSRLIVTNSLSSALMISNQYAPEHLILQIDHPEAILSQISNAGAVFIGPWTPETVGDYVTGANHVLPTDGYARGVSGLSVNDFMKWISIQRVSQTGLKTIAKFAERLADMEGLQAHKNAVTLRLEKMNELIC